MRPNTQIRSGDHPLPGIKRDGPVADPGIETSGRRGGRSYFCPDLYSALLAIYKKAQDRLAPFDHGHEAMFAT